jgi:hypothetical protein
MVTQTSSTELKTTATAAAATKVTGDTIDAASFKAMVDILDALILHTHTFYDDYSSNCQCNCSRGNL